VGLINPAQPASGTPLCKLDDIPDPGAKGFDFRVGDALFAGFVVRVGARAIGYVDRCPHAFSPLPALPDRYLNRVGDRIVCGTHGALFLIDDGRCVAGPCSGDFLTPWLVEVDMEGVVLTA
jgi:nitrite reductase/ring-hydroxylating ferredoxin subunit